MGRWMCERTGGQYCGDGVYIGLEQDGKLIAVCGFDNYNGRSLHMHIAAEGKRWMTKEYLWYCFHYPFVEVGVDKIIGIVEEGNKKAIRFDNRLGFVHEATIEDAHPNGAILILTMTKQQCRFLRNSEGDPSSTTHTGVDDGKQEFSAATAA